MGNFEASWTLRRKTSNRRPRPGTTGLGANWPCRGLGLLALLALLAGEARGNSWRAFGLGPRATAMAGAFAAVADDFSAAYYNPAGILARPGIKLGAGYQYVKENLQANGVEQISSRDADGIYLGGSMSIPFTDEWKDRVAIGYCFLQPIFYSIDILIPEATGPQFPTLESMARMQILHLVTAFDLIPGVLVGGGLTLSSDLGGSLDLSTGIAGFGGMDEVLTSVDQEVHPILSGTAGILVRPGRFHASLKPLSLGFVWRDEHSLDLNIPVQVLLSGFLLRLDLTSAFLYTPRQWVAGLGWRPSRNLLVACDVSYNEWSGYEVPSLSIDTDIDIPMIVLKKGVNAPPSFHDTVTPRVGVEFTPLRGRTLDFVVRGGYSFEPSPVPEQTGRTNLMDSNRHLFSWGMGLALKRLFGKELSGRSLSFDLAVALHWLEERVHRKGTGVLEDNPGYPEITSSGDLWVFTLGFTYGPAPEEEADSLH